MGRDFTAWEIACMSREQVESLPLGGLRITFSDGKTVKSKTTAIQESWFYWQINRGWGVDYIPHNHVVPSVGYNRGTHVDMMSKVFWNVFLRLYGNFEPGVGNEDFWSLSYQVYGITNWIYNYSTLEDGQFMTTLDITHLVGCLRHPEVMRAHKNYEEGEWSAEQVHDHVYATIANPEDPLLEHNEVAKEARCGNYDRRQLSQIIGPRESIPDINGEGFKTKIAVGYMHGLSSTYDRAIEGRTASIAYANQKDPLQDSQYNNRQCQLMGAVIRRITYQDCQTSATLNIRIRDEDDLKFVAGKFHMVNGRKELIFPDQKDLIGKTLKIRSITKCGHREAGEPCAICMGIYAWTCPPETTPGHHYMIDMLGAIGQKMLSTKHVIASTKTLKLEIDALKAPWLRLDKEDPRKVFLKDRRPNKGRIALRIEQAEAMFINDIFSCDDIEELEPSRVTNVNDIQIVEYDEADRMRHVHKLDMRVSNAACPLSTEMLKFFHDQEWEVNGTTIEVRLDDWDFNQPLMITPRRGDDMMEILNVVENFLDSKSTAATPRATDYKTPDAAIMGFFDAVKPLISKVGMINIEMFIRSLMSRIDEKGHPTYELPIGDEEFTFIRKKEAILFRSIGPALAFQGQDNLLNNPKSFLRRGMNIPAAEMDLMWG